MRDGVRIRSVASPLASDSVVLIRPCLERDHLAKGLARCLAHEGKPYDFDFDFRRSDRLVCTEVVYRAFDGLGTVHLPLVSRAGRPTLSGSDLIQMAREGQQFAPVGVFAPAWDRNFVIGPDVIPILTAGV